MIIILFASLWALLGLVIIFGGLWFAFGEITIEHIAIGTLSGIFLGPLNLLAVISWLGRDTVVFKRKSK